MKQLPLFTPPSTPPAELPPSLFSLWHETVSEWDRQGRVYTQREVCDEVARRAMERRERAYRAK